MVGNGKTMSSKKQETIEQSVTDCNHLGNAAKMHEALDKLVNFLRWEYAQDYPVSRDKLADAIDIGVSALAATPRNFDVLSKDEVLEMLKDRSFSKEDTIEWLCDEAKGAAEWTV